MTRALHTEERGAALVMVMFLGMALVTVATALTVRAARQVVQVALEADHEQALHVAESGLDEGLLALQMDPSFTTGEVAPGFATRTDERAWVLALAEAVTGTRLSVAPQGEYVVIRPVNVSVVYAVGYAPSRDAAERRVRIVRAELGTRQVPGGWFATYAMLSGGDLGLNGNPAVTSGRKVGIHANGFLEASGSVSVAGCVSASGGARISGSVVDGAECAAPGNQSPVEIPVVAPRSLWDRSQFDMCPDGKVRAGPAHPSMGRTAANRPCTGSVIGDASTTLLGWKFLGCCDAKDGARWAYDSDLPVDGVFYFFEGSAVVAKNPGSSIDPWQVTMIAEARGDCTAAVGGDVSISGSPTIVPHVGGSNLVVAAGKDLNLSGGMHASGIFAAHQQVSVSGNPSLTEASLLAEEACDSATTSSIHVSFVSGNPTVSNSGELSTPFVGTRTVEVMVGWDEL
ncbi:MAG: hypothetical protein HZA58_09175 [Acidimicrobiia bacterium]|nr:hypothetical protein [Acidimicrobiia bacterium]